MSRVRALLVASAVLLAACAGAASVSRSDLQTTNLATVHQSGATNAAAEMSDNPAKVNLPAAKTGAKPPVQPTAPAASPLVLTPYNSTVPGDRCGNEAGHPGKHPLPMCAPA